MYITLLRVIFLLHFPFLLSSSVRLKKKYPDDFDIFEPDPTPRLVFVKDLMEKFEYLLPELHFEQSDLFEPMEELVTFWKKEMKTNSSASVVKNYFSLSKEDRRRSSDDPLLFYFVHVVGCFAARAPDFVADFTASLISTKGVLAYPLMDVLESKDPKLLTRILCRFIAEKKNAEVETILRICPLVIEYRVDFSGNGQRVSPLAVAAYFGNAWAVQELIRMRVDVNEKIIINPQYGPIPVLFAALLNRPDSELIVSMIVNSDGFVPELNVDSHGLTPVIFIVVNELNPITLQMLADLFGFSRDDTLYDAYGVAIVKNLPAHRGILRFSRHFRANKKDYFGATYLMLAAMGNQAEAMEELISLDFPELKPGFMSDYNQSAFTFAIANQSYDALKVLTAHATEFEINDRYGANPLATAIMANDTIAVIIILDHPEVSLDTPFDPRLPGVSVMELAENMGNSTIIDILRDYKNEKIN